MYRLQRFREKLGLQGRLWLEPRPFPLELQNGRPTPKKVLEGELPSVGGMEPNAGWQIWQRPDSEWPGSVLLPLEAVQAAKRQSLEAAEQLDRRLRVAFFGESQPIGMRHVILQLVTECPAVDAEQLEADLDEGSARSAVIASWKESRESGVKGSPHLFLPDGSDVFNPGVTMHMVGGHGDGFPVIDRDEPSIYEDLLQRAAA